MQQYLELVEDILKNGVLKEDRTGTGTLSVFGRQLRFNLKEGFPLITTKKLHIKSIVEELLWILRGQTNIGPLAKKKVRIWDDWPYEKYKQYASQLEEPNDFVHTYDPKLNALRIFSKKEFSEMCAKDKDFAERFGELGPVYGHQWRMWHGSFDQISHIIDMLESSPDSRRILLDSWDPTLTSFQALPPCHYAFQCWTRKLTNEERLELFLEADIRAGTYPMLTSLETLDEHNIPKRALSLQVQFRSNDIGLGMPFNIASYALLTHILAHKVGMHVGELIYTIGDAHIYLNHKDALKEQICRRPLPLPKLKIKADTSKNIEDYALSDFEFINYQAHPHIKMDVSV